MLKASKIFISFMALLLAVYSLFNQSGILLFSLQVLVAVLFIIVGLELLSKKQIYLLWNICLNTYREHYQIHDLNKIHYSIHVFLFVDTYAKAILEGKQ